MHPVSFLIPILGLGLGGAAVAQTTGGDLNTLVSAAAHYVSSGMSAAHNPEALALCQVSGDNGVPASPVLMSSAADVQHWTFRYRIVPVVPPLSATPADAQPACPTQPPRPKPHVTVLAQCTRGVFNSFSYSPEPVAGVKSLEYTWVAVSLDQAIADLNAGGYVRGFSGVELMRPLQAGLPDDLVYVFTCPWERQKVAVSGQTGALAWTASY